MREIGSHDLEAKLAELNEMELHTAFKAMVGCDGKKIFVALDERAFDYFSKDSKYYKFKKLLIERKEFVTEFASAFRLDAEPLYKEIENIVKNTCKEFGLTYKQLGEKIGVSESTLLSIASTGKISKQIETAIELYKKTIELEEKLANSEKIKETLKEWLK